MNRCFQDRVHGNPRKSVRYVTLFKTLTIVTNYHVIQGATNVNAKLSSGAYFKIEELVGISRVHDLALLKFDAHDIPFIKIGKPPKVELGEQVFTIGSPNGLEKSVSEGIISNPERKEGAIDLIQFTAPISSGNSGGGLFTRNGDIVGIISNTIISSSPGQSFQNLNFAVPVKYVEKAAAGQDIEFTENSPDYYYSQGVIYSNNKKFDKAEKCLTKAISKDSNYAQAYIKLGDVYYELERYESEVNVLEKAQGLMPNDPEVWLSLAMAYEDIPNFVLAVKAYEKVLELRPKDKDAMFNVALLYVMLGLRQKAIALIPALAKMNTGLGTELQLLIDHSR